MLDLKLRQRGRWTPRMLFRGGSAGAWYDPSDLASMAQNADGTGGAAVGLPVGRIADKSGNGNHALQSVAAARPVLRLDGGGRLYLEFDGTDDEMRASFAMAQPWDRISALRQVSSSDFDRIFGGFAANSGNLLQHPTDPQIYMLSGAVTGVVATTTPAIGTNMVVSERHAGTSSRLIIDGAMPFTGDAGTTPVDGITLGGAGGSTGGRFANIRLYGALMIGRELGKAEASRLRRFMAARAGVQL